MLVGILLAGGKSLRMGQDKALLVRQGQTQLAHCYQLLQSLACDMILVSHPQYGLADRYSEKGPLAGIESCVNHFLNQAYSQAQAIVIPIDMPLLIAKDIELLITTSRITHQACCFSSTVLPFSFFINASTALQLKAQMKTSDLAIGRFLKQINTVQVSPFCESRLLNTNTPESWQPLTTTA